MEFSLNDILEATNAKVLKGEGVEGKFTFSTDTRTIKPGQIYLPLKGENFDGENFIDIALEAGAVGYFTTKQETANSKQETEFSSPFTVYSSQKKSCPIVILQVDDTLTAYLELARFCVRKIAPKTVAITGSSGKTTTKEMAYCVTSEKFKTHKSELNFNNEVGLCKTILSMPDDTQVLILEMGMRGLGEIELLSKYSEPDISIIANVGTAHIGRLGSRENIAKAKCEVVKYMKQGGVLIAHEDNLIKANPLTLQSSNPPIYFSLKEVQILEHKIGYSKFVYKKHEYELNIEGDYNIQNSLAAIELGLTLGMNESEIASGLKKYLPLEKRWEVQEVKGFKIINDSYNANPESMKAAISAFIELYQGERLIILGDMGELGDKETEYHQQIGDFLAKKINKDVKVLTVGPLSAEITKKLDETGILSKNFENNLQIARYIIDNVKIGTTIILKASRAMKFEEIIEGVNRGL